MTKMTAQEGGGISCRRMYIGTYRENHLRTPQHGVCLYFYTVGAPQDNVTVR